MPDCRLKCEHKLPSPLSPSPPLIHTPTLYPCTSTPVAHPPRGHLGNQTLGRRC